MDKKVIIKKFSDERPVARAVYGYGSGVFRQAHTSENGRVLMDAIFIVDDLCDWHHNNMVCNPSDYSLIGRVHLSRKNISAIKGVNKITYFSEIKDGEFIFKYGVIEIDDFLRSLDTWENIFVAGRFHKPVLEIESSSLIRDSIDYNRRSALIIACLFCDRVVSKKGIYNKLCGLSYLGDARMAIAENPHKVENIVDGSFDILEKIYPLDNDFLFYDERANLYYINFEVLASHFEELPVSLLNFLKDMNVDFNDIEMVRAYVESYLVEKNKYESRAQITEGVKTNGILRSVPYALAKVKKRFGK